MPNPNCAALCLALVAPLVAPLTAAQAPAASVSPPPAVDVRPVAQAKPIAVASIEALQGDGLFYFSGKRMVNLRVAGKAAGDGFKLVETTTDPTVASFNGNIDVQHFVRDGTRHAIGKPDIAIAADGGVQLVYPSGSPLRVQVSLQAYEVSGLMIRDFLRTPENFAKPEAALAGEAKFPAGSVAYLSSVRFIDDVLMLPRRESFTGAASTRQMLANFSKDSPYCLSYDDRNGARPYAMLFRDATAPRGRVQLYAAKSGTMFCARTDDQVLAEGAWEETSIGGTRAIVLSFPANVDPLDTGVTEVEREAARIAFIEPRKGAPGVRPGKLYRAGARIADYQYRFNAAAAAAIRSALGTK